LFKSCPPQVFLRAKKPTITPDHNAEFQFTVFLVELCSQARIGLDELLLQLVAEG
jgi:hypothetical protein